MRARAFVDSVLWGGAERSRRRGAPRTAARSSIEWWPTSLDGYRPGALPRLRRSTSRSESGTRTRCGGRASRLVEAADAERRRLERNLHDGAQQRLVSLSLALRLAESRAPERSRRRGRDPRRRGGGAGARAPGASRARARPPSGDPHRPGPRAALEALAERAPLPGRARGRRSTSGCRCPVEVAIFYVVSEALTNVAKYAGASAARSGCARAGDAVIVEVADDGVGGASHGGRYRPPRARRPRRGARRPARRREPARRRDARRRGDPARAKYGYPYRTDAG